MRALVYDRYGPPEVVRLTEAPTPEAQDGEILVRVRASGVNTGDWRLRAAAFPGVMAIPGRLLFGIFRPKDRRLGSEFAGVVEALGPGASRFAVGERVYGFSPNRGASADYLALPETAAIAPLPEGLSFEEGAALPFGGLAALVFLRRFGRLKAGQTVLINGASGGVGVYATQIAKAYGAQVTGVAGPENQRLLRELGADETVDYRAVDIAKLAARFDLTLDAVGGLTPAAGLGLLKADGVFLPLNYGLPEIGATLLNAFRRRKIKLAVNDDTADDLAALSALVEQGDLKPVIDGVYPLEDAAAAHARVESRRKTGAVVLRH